jgi:hypothetical protein
MYLSKSQSLIFCKKIFLLLFLKECKSNIKFVNIICYSPHCVSINNDKPFSLCKECHSSSHNINDEHFYKHVYQNSIDDFWKCNQEMKTYLADSIVKYGFKKFKKTRINFIF